MRVHVSGSLILLLAWVAVQIPWFTCHSDCMDACRPIWDLAAHHCHEESAHEHQPTHRCLCHDHGDPAEPAEDEGDGPGDHAILTALSPCPPPSTTFDVAANVLLAVEPLATDALPTGAGAIHALRYLGRLDTGPPPGLASVRLLL